MVRGERGNAPAIHWICRGQGERGNALAISIRVNVFEIEAILSVCRYDKFLNFVISFGCDTLITKSYFCPFLIIWDIF